MEYYKMKIEEKTTIEKDQKCHYNLMNLENYPKIEINLKNLKKIIKGENSLYFLRYRNKIWNLKILSLKSEIITSNTKNGGYKL